MPEKLEHAEFYSHERQQLDELSEKTLSERINSLKGFVAYKQFEVQFGRIMAVVTGGASAGLVTAQKLEVISGSNWWLAPEIICGVLAAAGILSIQQDGKKKKALEEVLEVQEGISKHPEAQGDETLARVVYDLDMRPTNEQVSNLSKVLTFLRANGLLIEQADSNEPLDK